MELLVTTDVDRGGAIAQNLRSIYVYLVRELITLRRPERRRARSTGSFASSPIFATHSRRSRPTRRRGFRRRNMPAPRTSAIARHVEAAKNLLRELEQQAATAMDALGRDQNAEFFAAVDDRTRTLERLDEIVEAIVQERALAAAEQAGQPDPATTRVARRDGAGRGGGARVARTVDHGNAPGTEPACRGARARGSPRRGCTPVCGDVVAGSALAYFFGQRVTSMLEPQARATASRR